MPRNYKPKNKHLTEDGKNKEGRLSAEEKRFLEAHYENLTIDEMCKELKRTVEPVEKYLEEHIRGKRLKGEKVKLLIKYDIKKQFFFQELKEQYNKRELQVIEAHWNQLIQQFNEDVLHSEVMQILSLCETEVSLSRIKKMERNTQEQLERMNKKLEELQALNAVMGDQDPMREAQLVQVDTTIASIVNGRKAVTDEKTKLETQKGKLIADLKGTREQRVKISTDQQMNWTSLLKALDQEDFRKKAVRENYLLQLSADQEHRRLSQDYQYIDGTFDKPILNAETVMADDEILEKKEEE